MHIKKIVVAVISLVLCIIVLISASFAWLTLSRVPEVTGIATHVGGNGSLEIALLTDETYMDPTQIRAGVGDSAVVQDVTMSNRTWGNVIDLSDGTYGLDQITIFPARLQLSTGEDGRHLVNSNMLMIPDYGIDGRFSAFNYDTLSATYRDSKFTYSTTKQSYGVRGIGTVSQMMPQQAALASARTLVRSYTSAATRATISTWNANGAGLLEIMYSHFAEGNNTYTSADVAVLRDTATRMEGAWSYVDAAIRQAVVGYAATVVEDVEQFKEVRSTVENVLIPISSILEVAPVPLPNNFAELASVTETCRLAMQRAIRACDALPGENFTWSQINLILSSFFTNYSLIFLQDTRLDRLDSSFVLTKDMTLTFTQNVGTMGALLEYIGNYTTVFEYRDGAAVTVATVSNTDPCFLTKIAQELDKKEAVAGNSAPSSGTLQNIYGYAVDMAFRCSVESKLLLQTSPELRVEDAKEAETVQGGGSYMRFSSEQLDTDQMLRMMDALRVGFIDNRGTLLGVAKLGTGSYEEYNQSVAAPLYFYEHTVSVDGTISVGQRLPDDREIMDLPEQTPVVLTVVVWLDGDHVDNGMAAVVSKSMTGTLNLQFASSADLDAADLTVQGKDN